MPCSYLVMPFMQTDLQKIMGMEFSEDKIQYLVYQMLKGLKVGGSLTKGRGGGLGVETWGLGEARPRRFGRTCHGRAEAVSEPARSPWCESCTVDSRFSLSLPNTVHPLSWGRPQGECFLRYILKGPARPWGLLEVGRGEMEQGEPGIESFQTQPWPRKACSEELLCLGELSGKLSPVKLSWVFQAPRIRSILELDGP